MPAPGPIWRKAWAFGRGGDEGGQEEAEACALAFDRRDKQRAAVALHDAEHGGEAEAAAGEFGRIERLENAGEHGGVAAGRGRPPARRSTRARRAAATRQTC